MCPKSNSEALNPSLWTLKVLTDILCRSWKENRGAGLLRGMVWTRGSGEAEEAG